MATMGFRGAHRPPSWVAVRHGLLAGAALILFIYVCATVGRPVMAKVPVGVFVIVALVGAWMNLNFHSKPQPLSKGTVAVHGLVALATFGMLVLALMHSL
jgi:hypothetical protein